MTCPLSRTRERVGVRVQQWLRRMRQQPIQHPRQHRIPLHQRLPVSEAQHLKSIGRQPGAALLISQQTFCREVLAAVEFNHQAGLNTGEIGKPSADRVLAADFVAGQLAAAQALPQVALSIGGELAQLTRPHPNPLPRAREGTGHHCLLWHAGYPWAAPQLRTGLPVCSKPMMRSCDLGCSSRLQKCFRSSAIKYSSLTSDPASTSPPHTTSAIRLAT